MHPISYEMQFDQRAAELRKEAERRRRIAQLPKQRQAKSSGKKVANAISVRRLKRA